jgi:hypothetical protein
LSSGFLATKLTGQVVEWLRRRKTGTVFWTPQAGSVRQPVGAVFPQNEGMLYQEKIRKFLRYALIGLPLAGVLVADFLPLTARAQQFLIMIVLIWLQVFFLFEVFMSGK